MKAFYNKISKKAVIIYGPPGAGKGTQAELLVRNFNFIHFDSGRYIEQLVHSPAADYDPILKREKINFDSGKLCTPSWVLAVIKTKTKQMAKSGYNIVYSGSPRTVYEAFGDKKTKGLFEILIKIFGKENVFVIQLSVPPSVSMSRNKVRRICSVCSLPAMKGNLLSRCLFCGGLMRTRTLDKPSVIKVRLKEYRERTFPILKRAKKLGIRIFKINGVDLPYKIHQQIVKKLKLR